ncbi:hypothetical protein AEGHOMDF_5153 [Methylobacterium soli]|nr:hypothetical protein AEGHOMDF_5153 [Methylobacterium soli]
MGRPDDAIAGCSGADAEIHVAPRDPQCLVEAAKVLERRSAEGHAGPGHGRDVADDAQLVEVARILARRPAPHVPRLSSAVDLDAGMLHPTIRIVELGADDTDLAAQRLGDELVEPVLVDHDGVVVEQDQHRPVRLCRAGIVAPRPVEDSGTGEGAQARVGCGLRQEGPCPRLGTLVVDDEHLEVGIARSREQAREARFQQLDLVAGRHDDRHLRRAPARVVQAQDAGGGARCRDDGAPPGLGEEAPDDGQVLRRGLRDARGVSPVDENHGRVPDPGGPAAMAEAQEQVPLEQAARAARRNRPAPTPAGADQAGPEEDQGRGRTGKAGIGVPAAVQGRVAPLTGGGSDILVAQEDVDRPQERAQRGEPVGQDDIAAIDHTGEGSPAALLGAGDRRFGWPRSPRAHHREGARARSPAEPLAEQGAGRVQRGQDDLAAGRHRLNQPRQEAPLIGIERPIDQDDHRECRVRGRLA